MATQVLGNLFGAHELVGLTGGKSASCGRASLVLQVKEALASVLERYVGASAYATHGERVVVGQRLMQSASDILLGWTTGMDPGRHFYIRQLRKT